MPSGAMSTRGKLAWGFVLLVAVLHVDLWLWDSTTIVLGFVPLTLGYQVGITVAAALGWALVMRYAWPSGVEEWAAASDSGRDAVARRSGGHP